MAAYFVDTSALVKLYVREPGTAEMLQIVGSEETHALALASVTPLELRSAVRRRERAGDLSSEVASQILERFTAQFETRFERVPVNEPLVEQALGLVDRHGLRAYDAVQLAACLQWKSSGMAGDPIFACADGALLAAARAEGVATLNPAESAKK
ncbi:MAG TPA: type II toxin-antitoxin system VapC family toxin [Candidatus Tyrphobacter sp.]